MAAQGTLDHELASGMSTAMVEGTGDLFPFLAFARGCHAAAETHRQKGNNEPAEFLHSLGQHFLSEAVRNLGNLVALDVHLSEVARH